MGRGDVAGRLPAFQSWSDGWVPPLRDPLAYITVNLDLVAVATVTDLFFPRFVEVAGCILRAPHASADGVRDFVEGRQRDGDTHPHSSTEDVFNKLHIWDLIQDDDESDLQEQEAMTAVVQRLAVTWKIAAQEVFPDRRFESETSESYGPAVSIFTTRK